MSASKLAYSGFIICYAISITGYYDSYSLYLVRIRSLGAFHFKTAELSN